MSCQTRMSQRSKYVGSAKPALPSLIPKVAQPKEISHWQDTSKRHSSTQPNDANPRQRVRTA